MTPIRVEKGRQLVLHPVALLLLSFMAGIGATLGGLTALSALTLARTAFAWVVGVP